MRTAFTVACAVTFAAVGAWAQDKKPPAPQQEAARPPAEVEYRPPARGAPRVRVGGSTRSMARALSLAVIAPDHAGLSAVDQPELYWYISRPVETPLEFTLVAVDATDPLVETTIAPVAREGIQRLRLADMKVRLKPGEEYQWLISFASKPGSRAKDAIASGRVRVQPPSQPLASYAEFARAGLVSGPAPRLYGAQADGCAPIVSAYERGDETARPWEGASTIADGLRVPKAVGDFLVLRAVRESGGTALTVSDRDMVAAMRELGSREGISAAPEGGAALHAVKVLVRDGRIKPTDSVVVFNTGGALKYLDVL